jgi:hypothetical protein
VDVEQRDDKIGVRRVDLAWFSSLRQIRDAEVCWTHWGDETRCQADIVCKSRLDDAVHSALGRLNCMSCFVANDVGVLDDAPVAMGDAVSAQLHEGAILGGLLAEEDNVAGLECAAQGGAGRELSDLAGGRRGHGETSKLKLGDHNSKNRMQ